MNDDNANQMDPAQQQVFEDTVIIEAMDEAADAADQVEAPVEGNTIPDAEADLPNLQQTSLVVCSLFIDQLQAGNEKYPPYFNSSNEAAGTIHQKAGKVLDLLDKIKSVNGFALDQESFDLGPDLKKSLAILGAMCIKTAYSLCHLQVECDRFNETLRQQQEVAEMIHGAKESEFSEKLG